MTLNLADCGSQTALTQTTFSNTYFRSGKGSEIWVAISIKRLKRIMYSKLCHLQSKITELENVGYIIQLKEEKGSALLSHGDCRSWVAS